MICAGYEEEQRIKGLKSRSKNKTTSCLESPQTWKTNFTESLSRVLNPATELALCGPGALIYEGQREDPYDRKNLRWIHTTDAVASSNGT